jgi:hypothetical protein
MFGELPTLQAVTLIGPLQGYIGLQMVADVEIHIKTE